MSLQLWTNVVYKTSIDDDLHGIMMEAQTQNDIWIQPTGRDFRFLVTQLSHDMGLFLVWVKECRTRGIAVPTIPDIMPIQNFGRVSRTTSFCKAFVLDRIMNALEPIKEDDQAVKNFGIKLAVEMYKGMQAGGIGGLYFYILDLEKSTA